jgi:hypothetical protein
MLAAFTLFHVFLSLVGLGAGLVVLKGLLTSQPCDRWTKRFLVTTVATSVTGFLFPVHQFMPSHGVGILSLIVLTIAILARYRYQLAGGWRRTYVITALIGLYLNFFVLVAQLFMKVPPLHALAPTGSEPPFQIAQLVLLVLFIAMTIRAAVKFHPPVSAIAG